MHTSCIVTCKEKLIIAFEVEGLYKKIAGKCGYFIIQAFGDILAARRISSS